MAKMRTIRLALLVFGMSVCAAAQSSSPSQPAPAPAPAFGQTAPVLNPENPPVSGLDEPTLELHTASRSFISPALQVSESADTNGGNQIGANGLESITRVLGALTSSNSGPRAIYFSSISAAEHFTAVLMKRSRCTPLAWKPLRAGGPARRRCATPSATCPTVPSRSAYGGNPGLGFASERREHWGQGAAFARLSPRWSVRLGRKCSPAREHGDSRCGTGHQSGLRLHGGGRLRNSHFYDPTNHLPQQRPVHPSGRIQPSAFPSRSDRRQSTAFSCFNFRKSPAARFITTSLNVRWSHTLTAGLSFIVGAGPQYTELERAWLLLRIGR